MKTDRARRRGISASLASLLLAPCFVSACLAAGSPSSLDARIAGECERLETRLAAVDASTLPDYLQDLPKQARAMLDRVKATQSTELKLYRMREAIVVVESAAFVYEHRAAGESLERLRALWDERRPAFEKEPPALKGSALERGLAEAARNRGRKLFRASLPYGKASEPFSGVYYLGEAEGNLRFSEFAASVHGSAEDRSPRPSPARLVESLETLDAETLATFALDPAGQTMIPVNASLKEARELLEEKLYDGATLLLLEARLGLSRRKSEAAKEDASSFDPATAGKETGDSLHDVMLAWAREDKGVRGLAIQRDVFPFYQTMFTPATKSSAKLGAVVKVTLVRWPYT